MTTSEIADAIKRLERQLLLAENDLVRSWPRVGQQAGPVRFRQVEQVRWEMRLLAKTIGEMD